MSTPNPELLTCIEELIGRAEECMPTDLTTTQREEGGSESWSDLRQNYIAHLDLIASRVAETKLEVLQDLCVILQSQLQELSDQGKKITEQEWALLLEWPALLMAYAQSPEDTNVSEELLRYLCDPFWLAPLSEEYVESLKQLLLPESNSLISSCDEQTLPVDPLSSDAMEEDEIKPDGMVTGLQREPDEKSMEAQLKEDLGAFPDHVDDQCRDISATVEGLNSEQQELVDLLCAELRDIITAQEDNLSILSATESNFEARYLVWDTYIEHMERIGSAAEMVGLAGLQQASKLIQANFQVLAGHRENTYSQATLSLLKNWPVHMQGYLQAIHNKPACENFTEFLRNAAWPHPLEPQESTALIDLLASATVIAEDSNATPRQTQAQTEDVSLQIPEDVDKELLDGLLQELPSQAAEFSAAIHRALDGGFLSDVDVAQRIAHTLKGAGNVVGVRGVATLTHHLEDILQALSKQNVLPPPALAEILVRAADCLEAMSDALIGFADPPADAVEVLQEVLDWINLIDRQGLPIDTIEPENDSVSSKLDKPASLSDQGTSNDTVHQAHETKVTPPAVTETPVQEANLRIPAELADDLLRLAGESMISTAQIQEQVRNTMDQVKSLRQQHLYLQQFSSELEQLVDIRGFWSHLGGNISKEGFDSLELNQYNELHTITHRLIEAMTDASVLNQSLLAQLQRLNTMAVDQERLNRENQEMVMKTRMVPVDTVVPRLKRSLRQACRMTGKEAQLHVVGAATLMDSNVLSNLMDPLMHLLRNAVDHGLESPVQRVEAGKNVEGRIDLEISRQGDHILVRCRDDGAGLDYEAIQLKAVQRGLITSEQSPTEEELKRILFAPGFTTRDQVTQVSGRGIGMDAVSAAIRQIKGTIDIQSKRGQGMVVELLIPVTLLSGHTILVRVRNQIMAIANRGVEALHYSDAGQIQDMGNTLIYQLGDEVFEAEHLDKLLNLPPDRRKQPRQPSSVLLIRKDSGSKSAILVQQILDTQDVVVKPLGQFTPKAHGVVGATILGDGSIAPVLDLTELLNRRSYFSIETAGEKVIEEAARRLPWALVVDDSLSARRSLAQFVQDIGLEVRTARDGMEAAEIIEARSPDILLVDLEMPRMNGLELTSHVRAQKATQNVPVIMITSRSTEKHRQQAERAGVNIYMTKPYAEDELATHIHSCIAHA